MFNSSDISGNIVLIIIVIIIVVILLMFLFKSKYLKTIFKTTGGADYNALVLSGPSGCGKSTIIKYLNKLYENKFGLVVSTTTRLARSGEKNDVDYHFVKISEFKNKIDNDEFFEYDYAESYDTYYGTTKEAITSIINKGKIPIFDVNHKGVKAIQTNAYKLNLNPYYVCISPSTTWDEARKKLDYQLHKRATEDEKTIQKRLIQGEKEWKLQNILEPNIYDVHIYNDGSLEEFYQKIKPIAQKLI